MMTSCLDLRRARRRRHPNRPNAAGGFTLLELVLVMVLITIALAAAVPDLRGFYRGSRLKNAATQLVALAQWCRTQAVTEGRIYRLNADAAGYWVTAQDLEQFGGQFVQASSDFGRVFAMPEETRLTLARGDGMQAEHVDFFPDGRTEVAEFRITRADGRDEIRVICPTPTERFHVAAEDEVLAIR